jgi:hypothetical protein
MISIASQVQMKLRRKHSEASYDLQVAAHRRRAGQDQGEHENWTQVANRFIWFVDLHGSYKLGESQESTCIHPDSTPKRKWLRRSGGNSQASKPSGPRIQNKSSVLVEENESFVSYDPIS